MLRRLSQLNKLRLNSKLLIFQLKAIKKESSRKDSRNKTENKTENQGTIIRTEIEAEKTNPIMKDNRESRIMSQRVKMVILEKFLRINRSDVNNKILYYF
jgi:hypothetical protein